MADVAAQVLEITARVEPPNGPRDYATLQSVLSRLAVFNDELATRDRATRSSVILGEQPCDTDPTGVCQGIRQWRGRLASYIGTIALWPAATDPRIATFIDKHALRPLLHGDFSGAPELAPFLPVGFRLDAVHAPDIGTAFSLANQLNAVDFSIDWDRVAEEVAAGAASFGVAVRTAAAALSDPLRSPALIIGGLLLGGLLVYRLTR